MTCNIVQIMEIKSKKLEWYMYVDAASNSVEKYM